MPKKIYRSKNTRIIGGVCGGLAEYFNIDPLMVRILFAVLAFWGFGIFMYVLMWIFVPEAN